MTRVTIHDIDLADLQFWRASFDLAASCYDIEATLSTLQTCSRLSWHDRGFFVERW